MLKNIKLKIQKLPKTITYSLIVLIIWLFILIFQSTAWIDLAYVIIGAMVGYLILEVDWVRPKKKELQQLLPIIILPLTLFILTSTRGMLGKSIIVFLNLRLIVKLVVEKNGH